MEKFLLKNSHLKTGLVRNQIFDFSEIVKVPLSARVANRSFKIPKISPKNLIASLGETSFEGSNDKKEDSQKKPQDKPAPKDEDKKLQQTSGAFDEPIQKPCINEGRNTKTEECSDTDTSSSSETSSTSSSSSSEDDSSDSSTSSTSSFTEEYAEKNGVDTFGYPVISVDYTYLRNKSKQAIADEKKARREERRKPPMLSIFSGKPLELCDAGLKYLDGKCDDNNQPKVIRQTQKEFEKNMAAFREMRRKEWERRQKRREERKEKLKKERELEETLEQKEK